LPKKKTARSACRIPNKLSDKAKKTELFSSYKREEERNRLKRGKAQDCHPRKHHIAKGVYRRPPVGQKSQERKGKKKRRDLRGDRLEKYRHLLGKEEGSPCSSWNGEKFDTAGGKKGKAAKSWNGKKTASEQSEKESSETKVREENL